MLVVYLLLLLLVRRYCKFLYFELQPTYREGFISVVSDITLVSYCVSLGIYGELISLGLPMLSDMEQQ